MSGQWKTLAVIVEIPVQGDMNESDLRWKVENMLSRGGLSKYFVDNGCRVGRLQIKRKNRVDAGKRGNE